MIVGVCRRSILFVRVKENNKEGNVEPLEVMFSQLKRVTNNSKQLTPQVINASLPASFVNTFDNRFSPQE